MSALAAIITSNAALVRCELSRVRPQIELDGPHSTGGVGAYQDQVVLQRHHAAGGGREALWEVPDSDIVVLHAGPVPLGQAIEENAQPFRFRQWLFALVGDVDKAEPLKDLLWEQLPDSLQAAVRGTTLAEVIFAQFLAQLRALSRTEDPDLGTGLAAGLLKKTARLVEQASNELGGTAQARLAMVASNGKMLIAARKGSQPLAYQLLEGRPTCERCGLQGAPSEATALARDHRRRRSVVIASAPLTSDGWISVADGGALGVDRDLAVQLL